jgi:outer membrane receptor protein involved in Fe transport
MHRRHTFKSNSEHNASQHSACECGFDMRTSKRKLFALVNRRISPAVFPIAVFVLLITSANAAAGEFRNLTIEQALEKFRANGVTIFYSSDLIKPWMRVRGDPSGDDPQQILLEILDPYGVSVTEDPTGNLLLVRKTDPEPAWGTVTGIVVRKPDGSPLSGASVSLDASVGQFETANDGTFYFSSVPIGRHSIAVSGGPSSDPVELVFDVNDKETTRLTIEIEEAVGPKLTEVIVSASQYQLTRGASTSVTSFSAADLELIPNVGDDPMRAVARLPGMASGELSAKSNVRGGEVDEMLVQFDDLRLYNPFHLKDFQSTFSAIDPGITSGMDVYTGGFPAEYGDRMSSVVEIESLPPPDGIAGEISASFFHLSGLIAGSYNDGQGDWLLSARRGNMDLILDVLDPKLGDPTYIDVFGRLSHWFSESFGVTGNFLVFDDDILVFDTDQEEEARADYRDEYYWLRFDVSPTQDFFGKLLVARTRLDSKRVGHADQQGVARGSLRDERSFTIDSLQTDWSWHLADPLQIEVGGELRSSEGYVDYHDQAEFDVLFLTPGASLEQSRTRDLAMNVAGNHYGAYINFRVDVLPRLTAEAGLRWDKETLSAENDSRVSPRISLLYRLGESTRLRSSWGRFSQAQYINELQISDGVTDYFPSQRVDHFVASIEHGFSSGIELRIEAYHKDYDDLRPRFENLLNTFIILPELKPDRVRIAPDGGTARGVELVVRRPVSEDPLSWWLSYSWSSVKDEIKNWEIRRSWDQTHYVSAGIAWITEKWDFSLATTYHTGWSTTSVELLTLEPIPLLGTGPRNGERLSPYNTVDVRVARKYSFSESNSLTVFFELKNALNRTNECCIEFEINTDRGSLDLDAEAVHYLPILPSAGFIWRF